MYNFDPYNVFLSIATNIPVLLKTDFVLQAHIYTYKYKVFSYLKIKKNAGELVAMHSGIALFVTVTCDAALV